MASEIIAHDLHLAVVGAVQIDIGYGVEPYQIDTAFQSAHQPDNLAGMGRRIVHSVEHDILERGAPLGCEVVLLQKFHHFFYRHLLLGRHQLHALFVQW